MSVSSNTSPSILVVALLVLFTLSRSLGGLNIPHFWGRPLAMSVSFNDCGFILFILVFFLRNTRYWRNLAFYPFHLILVLARYSPLFEQSYKQLLGWHMLTLPVALYVPMHDPAGCFLNFPSAQRHSVTEQSL